jgi:hypothetical protein
MSETLTLAQASIRSGVSVTTLRRRVQSGTLRAEPRANSRQPVLLSLQALIDADLVSQTDSQVATQSAAEVRAQMLAERVEALEDELREVRAKAETASELVGEVRAWRQVAEEAQRRLAEGSQLAIQSDTQLATEAVSERSGGFWGHFRRKG